MAHSFAGLKGNLTRDPELHYGDGGVARLTFSIASTERMNRDGEWIDGETSFFDCVAWRGTAEQAAPILEKGIPVIVLGKLVQRSWEDKESGDKRSKVEVVVDAVGPNCMGITSVERRQRGDSASRSKPVRNQPPVQDYDEEPF